VLSVDLETRLATGLTLSREGRAPDRAASSSPPRSVLASIFAELAEAGRRARAIRCTAARTHRGASDEGFGFPSNRGDTTTGFHGTSAN